jgi:hypothetical protein
MTPPSSLAAFRPLRAEPFPPLLNLVGDPQFHSPIECRLPAGWLAIKLDRVDSGARKLFLAPLAFHWYEGNITVSWCLDCGLLCHG